MSFDEPDLVVGQVDLLARLELVAQRLLLPWVEGRLARILPPLLDDYLPLVWAESPLFQFQDQHRCG